MLIQLLRINFLCLALISITSIAAQVQPAYVVIDEAKGLQSNIVYDTYVAQNGLLYIAHAKGLSSFDGSRFINYYNKDYPFTEVSTIVQTSNGDLFCKAFNNAIFKLHGDTLKWYANGFNNLGFTPSTAHKNNLITAINDSILITNTTNNRYETITMSNLSNNKVVKNPIFIGKVLVKNNPLVALIDEDYTASILPNNKEYSTFHYSNGNVFFCPDKLVNTILHYNTGEKINIQTPFKNVFVNYISLEKNIIWICTNNGIFYRNVQDVGHSFKHVLQGFNISDFVVTKDNACFASTLDKGLLFIPNLDVKIIVQSNEKITASCFHNNQLQFSNTNNNLLTYSLVEKKITSTVNNAIANTSFLLKDGINNVISGKSSIINNQPTSFAVKDYCYVNTSLLLAASSGVYLVNGKSNHWVNKHCLNKNELQKNNLTHLNFSKEHTSNIKYNEKLDEFYISNYSGLFRLRKQDSMAMIMPEPYCVLKDICVFNGKLLLATKDKGILQWNGKTYENAFPNHPVKDIFYKFEVYEDELWVLGETALYCFKNNDLFNYGNEVGINCKGIKSFSVTKDIVYLTTANAIIELPKKVFVKNSSYANLIINKVFSTTNNATLSSTQILAYNNNSIQFQLSLINYTNASNTHIAYSVNSSTLKHLAPDARELSFNFLQPNKYTINFYIVSNGIIASKPSQSFSFTIKQPFYFSWWFLCIITIVVLFILWQISIWRINRIKRQIQLKQEKNNLEKELDKSVLSSIRSQMNPHFIFNALNTIQSYVYMNDKRNASIYISKFSDLTRSILDMSNKETITLTEEINALKLYLSLEKMRFEESFEYTIDVDQTLQKDSIVIPPMLLQPYVENAIKHGLLHRKNNRKLDISFKKINNYLQVIIEDNGIGRQRSSEINALNRKNYTSFSTAANRKRVEILKQQYPSIELKITDKYNNHGIAEGTLVEVLLPIQ